MENSMSTSLDPCLVQLGICKNYRETFFIHWYPINNSKVCTLPLWLGLISIISLHCYWHTVDSFW